jgi:hypothetical protein
LPPIAPIHYPDPPTPCPHLPPPLPPRPAHLVQRDLPLVGVSAELRQLRWTDAGCLAALGVGRQRLELAASDLGRVGGGVERGGGLGGGSGVSARAAKACVGLSKAWASTWGGGGYHWHRRSGLVW